MSKKEKKALTTRQKKFKYRVIEYSVFASEFISIITPFIVLGIINREEWFIQNPNSWKISLGGTIAIAVTSIAVLLSTKMKKDTGKINGYVPLVIGFITGALILTLLADIITQVANVMWFAGIGLAGGLGLDIVSNQYGKKADKCNKLLEKAEETIDHEKAVQEIQEERKLNEEKKVKIKIKIRKGDK